MANSHRIGTDELERQVIANINECGWHAVHVIEDDGHPPWTYTIGLSDTWNHPELIVIGGSRATSHIILNAVAAGLETDQRLDLSSPSVQRLGGVPCYFVDVGRRYYADYVGFACWYYGRRTFHLLQVVWSDHQCRYPWDPNAPASFKKWQPLLGRPPTRS